LALAAILAFAASCVTYVHKSDPIVGDAERLVTLSITTPSSLPTRALTGTQEDAVHTVDVLLFKGEVFFYRAIGDQPNASNQFTVKLPSNATAYKAVVLANARSMLSATPVAREQVPGTTRANLLASITRQLTLPVTGWTSALAANGIPMWGYENNLVVNEESSNPAATIALTRMVAKIDITVDNDVTNFKLANARLYNYSSEGTIAPAASTSATSGYDVAQWDGTKAIAPHLPSGAKVADGHIDYSISAAPGSLSFTNEIYAYEAQAGTANTVTNTCLVIGGYYEGSTTPTYYRVEFVESGGTTFLHLLRNHKYAVTIKEVSDHGYSTANDAYMNKPVNITVQITAWNDAGLDDITFDPQHYLAVDKSEFFFYASGGNKTMEAITDFPAGWTIEKDAVYDWFTVAPLTHASTSRQTITVTIPNGSVPRDGHFDIVAGNLHKRIFVTQSDEEEFSIFITDPVTGEPLDELTFGPGGAVPAARQILVTWLPADVDCEVALISGTPSFTFDDSGEGIDPVADAPFTGGSKLVTIQPNDLAPGAPDLLSSLDFTVSRGGQYRMASVYLRQVNKYIIVEGNAGEYMVGNTTPYTFTVKSNIPWYSAFDGAKGDEFTLVNTKTANGGPNPAGEIFEFTLHNRPGAEATFSFKSTENALTYAAATIEGVAPFLTITEPNGVTTVTTHDFGETSTPLNIQLATNATSWKYTVAGGDLSDIVTVTTPDPFPDDTPRAGSTGAGNTFTQAITFQPKTSTKGGTTTRTLTFTTLVDQPGVTEVTKVLTLKRTIPVVLERVDDLTTIPAAGGTATFTVNANTTWWVSYDAQKKTSENISSLTSSALSLNIPANTGGVGRKLTISFGIVGDDTPLFTSQLSQPGANSGKKEAVLVAIFIDIDAKIILEVSDCPPGYLNTTLEVGDKLFSKTPTPYGTSAFDNTYTCYISSTLLYFTDKVVGNELTVTSFIVHPQGTNAGSNAARLRWCEIE
jgi:hypothetical protein